MAWKRPNGVRKRGAAEERKRMEQSTNAGIRVAGMVGRSRERAAARRAAEAGEKKTPGLMRTMDYRKEDQPNYIDDVRRRATEEYNANARNRLAEGHNHTKVMRPTDNPYYVQEQVRQAKETVNRRKGWVSRGGFNPDIQFTDQQTPIRQKFPETGAQRFVRTGQESFPGARDGRRPYKNEMPQVRWTAEDEARARKHRDEYNAKPLAQRQAEMNAKMGYEIPKELQWSAEKEAAQQAKLAADKEKWARLAAERRAKAAAEQEARRGQRLQAAPQPPAPQPAAPIAPAPAPAPAVQPAPAPAAPVAPAPLPAPLPAPGGLRQASTNAFPNDRPQPAPRPPIVPKMEY